MHVFAKSMHVFAKSFPFFLRNFAARMQTMKHTATNRRQQAAMTFTSDCLNILTQLEDRLSMMVDQRVEAAVERKFRQMNINNNK